MPTRNLENVPENGKIAALDVGEKTIGTAISDKGRRIATPGQTLTRGKWAQTQEKLKHFIASEEIVCLIIGLPLGMDGNHTPQTDSTLSFAQLAEQDLNLPVILWDERLTTRAAEAAMFEQRTGRQKRASKKDVKQQIDSVAAALILQSALAQLERLDTKCSRG